MVPGKDCIQKEGEKQMLQKIYKAISDCRRNRKGQAVIELAFGLLLIYPLMMTLFDFSLIVRTKIETMTMARNAVRLIILEGASREKNQKEEQDGVQMMIKMFRANHDGQDKTKFVSVSSQEDFYVKSDPGAGIMKNGETGKDSVFAKACITVHPMGPIVRNNMRICSGYKGYHSSQAGK